MKNWKRIVTAAAVVAVGLTVGLTSASASPSTPTPSVPTPTAQAGVRTPASVANLGTPPARTESAFVPIAICRAVDTRKFGGALTNNMGRNFVIAGTAGFATQGGTNGGCGVPADATAASVVVYAVAPTHSGYLEAYPFGAGNPGTSIVNYPATVTSNGNSTIGLNVGAITVFNGGGPTQVVVAVNGYYVAPKEGLFNIAGGQFSGSQNVVSAVNTSAGHYVVTWDSNVQNCTPEVTPWPGFVTAAGTLFYTQARDDIAGLPNQTNVDIWTLDPTTHLPVFQNNYYYLTVTC